MNDPFATVMGATRGTGTATERGCLICDATDHYRCEQRERFASDELNDFEIDLGFPVTVYLNENGLIHRNNDLPAVVGNDNDVSVWYKHGRMHRERKPAFTGSNSFGDKVSAWCIDGKLHRDNGPAYFKPSTNTWYSQNVKEYYVHGKEMNEKQFRRWRLRNNPLKTKANHVRVAPHPRDAFKGRNNFGNTGKSLQLAR